MFTCVLLSLERIQTGDFCLRDLRDVWVVLVWFRMSDLSETRNRPVLIFVDSGAKLFDSPLLTWTPSETHDQGVLCEWHTRIRSYTSFSGISPPSFLLFSFLLEFITGSSSGFLLSTGPRYTARTTLVVGVNFHSFYSEPLLFIETI